MKTNESRLDRIIRGVVGAILLVLFLTNFFAIVLAGGGVFWLSGIHARRQLFLQAAVREPLVQEGGEALGHP